MGMIYGKGKYGIPKLSRGDSTMINQSRVFPATLDASSGEGHFGDFVKLDTTSGFYSVISASNTITSAEEIVGVIKATLVKSPLTYPMETAKVATLAGESFNLLTEGFIAVPTVEGTTEDKITVGGKVRVTTEGIVTTDESGLEFDKAVFTGVTQLDTDGKTLLAEIKLG